MFGNMKNVSLPPSDFMFLIRIPCDSFGKMKDLGDCLRAKGIAWIVGWTVAKDALGLWVWIVAWVGTGVGSTAENDGKADWALSFSVVWGLVFWGIFCWGLLALPLCLMVTLCGFLLAVLLELMKEWVVKTEELTIIFPNLPYMAHIRQNCSSYLHFLYTYLHNIKIFDGTYVFANLNKFFWLFNNSFFH